MGDGWWRVTPAMGEKGGRALLYRIGPERFTDRVLIAWTRSDAGVGDAAWHELATLPRRWTAPVFPLRAKDFIKRGVGKGPQLGAALRAAEDAWIAADFPRDKAVLGTLIDTTVAALTGA